MFAGGICMCKSRVKVSHLFNAIVHESCPNPPPLLEGCVGSQSCFCSSHHVSFFLLRLFETLQSLFWSIFGLLNLYVTNVKARHEFTEFIGATMFGTYNVISLVVLLNMLIAMMNNSYQLIAVSHRADRFPKPVKSNKPAFLFLSPQDHADIEWKFARTKLWMSYFDEGGTLPPPFNIVPSPKSIWYLLMWLHNKLCRRGQPPGDDTHKCENLREFTVREREMSFQMSSCLAVVHWRSCV